MDNPFALFQMLFQETRPRVSRPSIAVIHATGPIVTGDVDASAPHAMLFSRDQVASRKMVRALSDARTNALIRGVVLRIDSPGGSALASEVIWQAVHELARHKPVYVSIGHMAASGGYYIACAGEQIYVTPGTMVGSIGVVGGKFVLGGLYEKIGLSVHRRGRGPMADMFNSVEPFTNEQRQQLKVMFQRTYDLFTDRVTEGRGDRIADIDKVAHGRLFTGNQAVENGLADHIGSVDDAIAALAARLNLPEGQYDILDLPPPMTFPEFLKRTFGGAQSPMAASGLPAVQAVRAVLGPAGWHAAAQTLDGLMLLRNEPVLMLMPVVIQMR